MSFAYTVKDQSKVHFVTFTVHQWVNVFTRQEYIDIFINSIVFCQQHKGLEVYGWVVMSNHIHLIIGSKRNNLSDVIRDIKKFTAKAIYKAIETNNRESRKNWLLMVLTYNNKIWFWEEGYHAEEIYTRQFFEVKLKYLHLNPVRAGIVDKEEEYNNSSAATVYGLKKGPILLNDFN